LTFFVDTNVIVYGAGDPKYGAPCGMLLEAIARGDADGQTSIAVLEEVWHLELSGRNPNFTGLTQRALETFSPLLIATEDTFRMALALDVPGALGANDRLHVATCQAHGVDTIVSADSSFDGIPGIHRIDPVDRQEMLRLMDQS